LEKVCINKFSKAGNRLAEVWERTQENTPGMTVIECAGSGSFGEGLEGLESWYS
jgi:hypothetical protein